MHHHIVVITKQEMRKLFSMRCI